jgi:hypothetical protein
MLAKLIKFAIAALVIHGAWQIGSAYWAFYRFEDRLTQIAQFGDRRKDVELCQEAAEAAALVEVPVTLERVSVQRGSNPAFNCVKGFEGGVAKAGIAPGKITFKASYGEDIAVLPGYRYPWTFDAHIEVWARAY